MWGAWATTSGGQSLVSLSGGQIIPFETTRIGSLVVSSEEPSFPCELMFFEEVMMFCEMLFREEIFCEWVMSSVPPLILAFASLSSLLKQRFLSVRFFRVFRD